MIITYYDILIIKQEREKIQSPFFYIPLPINIRLIHFFIANDC